MKYSLIFLFALIAFATACAPITPGLSNDNAGNNTGLFGTDESADDTSAIIGVIEGTGANDKNTNSNGGKKP
uniref:Lipoprotein n=1 Tax=Steinernema glaseri TaxID=37863 RepID=A0A1I7ZSL9_9BILA